MTDNANQPVKRFIAGAVCPRCKAIDKILAYRDEQHNYRECVACGFHDKLHIQPQFRELVTRVNTPEEVKQAETQVLNFSPAPGKKSED